MVRAKDLVTASSPQPPRKSLLEWAGATRDEDGNAVAKKKRPRRKTIAASTFNRARVETAEMMETGDWSTCKSRHLVALYDIMHERVYGVTVTSSGEERHEDAMKTAGFVKREFDGDYTKAIEYFRWLWSREIGREKWRRETGNEGQRLTVGTCICGKVFTDYKLALTRRPR